MSRPSIILFNKPYGVLSQFRQDTNNSFDTLATFFNDSSLRVAGRLDATSEGLLVLTGSGKLDGKINQAITHPPKKRSEQNHNNQSHKNKVKKQGKTYLVQVEGIPSLEQLNKLQNGVLLKDGLTLPADAFVIAENELPIRLWERNPPIRERKNTPTSWIQLTIFEGKNRQVRRMTAHVGLPCLRLIRYSVAGFDIGRLEVGEFVRVSLNDNKLKALNIQNF